MDGKDTASTDPEETVYLLGDGKLRTAASAKDVLTDVIERVYKQLAVQDVVKAGEYLRSPDPFVAEPCAKAVFMYAAQEGITLVGYIEDLQAEIKELRDELADVRSALALQAAAR